MLLALLEGTRLRVLDAAGLDCDLPGETVVGLGLRSALRCRDKLLRDALHASDAGWVAEAVTALALLDLDAELLGAGVRARGADSIFFGTATHGAACFCA